MASPRRRRPVAKKQIKTRVNKEITAPHVRVVDEKGKMYGVLATKEAINLAEEKGFDLVEVSPKMEPPVCRIMDYGKYKYQISKKQHDARKKQVIVKVKEIKMRPKTEEHDFQFKLKHARNFLKAGHRVKVTVQFRGREMAFVSLGIDLLHKFQRDTGDVGIMENNPRAEGRTAVMILAPKK